ncbi:MAG: NADH-quinone oxidoreductase subunit N [Myxococcales bacterium]|nr:NADH-quinone oxidoreductase subunit N [Myxococcales bacterium]
MGLTVASALVVAVTALVHYNNIGDREVVLFNGMLVADKLGYLFSALAAFAVAIVALIAGPHQRTHAWENGEFFGILLLSSTGIIMLAHAGDLMTIFLGIETLSIAVYVLTALRKKSARGNEAAMKYFLMGAFATGILVYGMALLYGAAGTTNLAAMAERLVATPNLPLTVAGAFLVVIAFGFKIAAVPFHMWAPDAYEGAPTPVTAFMAAAVKAAAVVAMIRVFGTALGGEVLPFGTLGWASPLVIMAALTMTAGNLAALKQNNIKRLLAYSSISHAGVILVGVTAMAWARPRRFRRWFYVMAYGLTTLGAFAVVAYIGSKDRERLLLDDWAGLATSHPGAALAMTICMLSLGGIPPTAGFMGKFQIFKSAMEVYDGQLLWLVILGILNSAVSIYYYLKVVTAMYFKPVAQPVGELHAPSQAFVIALCAVLVMAMGLLPSFWMGL